MISGTLTGGVARLQPLLFPEIDEHGVDLPSPAAPCDAPAKSTAAKTGSNGKPRPKKPTDPRVSELIAFFHTQYQVRFGIKYIINGARDGKIFKDLLADHTLEDLKTSVELFINDEDAWLRDNGARTIPVFRSRINQYLQQATQRKHPGHQSQAQDHGEKHQKKTRN